VVARVRFKDAKTALVILKQFLEQRPFKDVTPLIQSIQTLQKEIGS